MDRLVELARLNMEQAGQYGYSAGGERHEQSYRDDDNFELKSPRGSATSGFGCMGCCNGVTENAKLAGPPPEKSLRGGIKKG